MPLKRAAFLRKWQGTPYDRQTRHCWWWVALVQRELFGREMPLASLEEVEDRKARALAFSHHPARKQWQEVAYPENGAVVLMARALGGVHAGVYIDGLIWHTDEPHGVVADTPLELEQSRRWRLTYLVPVAE